MRATGIVEYHPFADAGPCVMAARICFEMYLLVFERAPDPLDENVVHPATAPVHSDADAGGLEPARLGRAGELRALVGAEYLWLRVTYQRLVGGLQAQGRIHRIH